jgi:hypothetical protein
MKFKRYKNILLFVVGIFISGIAGFWMLKNSSVYNKVKSLKSYYPVKSEQEKNAELEAGYKRDIEGDVFYISTLLMTDTLDNPASFVMLKREMTFIEPIERQKLNMKDVYIQYYINYRYKDSTGKRIFGTKCMNFDKNLNFIGVGNGR